MFDSVWQWTTLTLTLSLALTLAGGASAGEPPRERGVGLESAGLSMVFGLPDDHIALRKIAGPNGEQWLGDFDSKAVLWRIALSGPNGASKEITSADVKLTRVAGVPNGHEFDWSVPVADGAAAEVAMTVRTEKDKPLSYWSLKAQLPDGWKVLRSDFPVIPNVRPGKKLKLAAPVGWGLEYDVEPGMGYSGTYPSCVAAMQFVAFYEGDSGLYIGMHDAQGNHKSMSVKASESGEEFACVNWPAIAEIAGGTYEVPFEAVVGVFRGGYYEAAQIYREFTFKAPWGMGGPVSKRAIPQWLKDTDLWLMPDAEPVKNIEPCVKAKDFFGVPISLHWYNWHQIPFDTLYPDYFPARRGFAGGTMRLQEAGFHVMPYINGRLADPNSRFWTKEDGEKAACKQEDGKVYTEVYGSKVPLNVMCPFTDGWQRKVGELVDRLVNEYKVDGVYIDQIGAAAPNRCFDPSHGHPLGGGRMWVDGYRKMLDDIRKKLPAGAMLTTEEDGECWIDQLDALLLVNTSTAGPKPIPLFPAVYSGRALTFGFQYIKGDDISKSLPFRAKMARGFCWGTQLGWVSVGAIMAPEAAPEAEFLRNLARARRFAHQFAVTGRFLGMTDVTGDNPLMICEASGSFGGTYKIDTPSVIASAWIAEDKTLGLLVANMSDQARQVDVKAPLSEAAIKTSAGFRVATFGSEGKLSETDGSAAAQRVSVPARGAVVLVLKK